MRRYLASAGARVLDVGSGTGALVRELETAGYRATGIDPLASGAGAVRGDGLCLPFRAARFDGVTMLDVLEHVDDDSLLREAARVLRPGGAVFLTVPASDRLWSSRDDAAGHLRRYTRRTLTRVIESAGLKIVHLTCYQFFLFPLLVAARVFGRNSSAVRAAEERPGPAANALFRAINLAEARCAPLVRWPWGSSLVAVCTK